MREDEKKSCGVDQNERHQLKPTISLSLTDTEFTAPSAARTWGNDPRVAMRTPVWVSKYQ